MTTVAISEPSGAGRIFLSIFLRGFMEYSQSRGAKDFPPSHSHLWHKLLSEMKKKYPAEFGNLTTEDLEVVMDGVVEFLCEERPDFRILPKLETRLGKCQPFSKPQNFDAIVGAAYLIAISPPSFF